MSPDGLAEPSLLERLIAVVLHNDVTCMAEKPVADFTVLAFSRDGAKTKHLRKFRPELFVAFRETPLKPSGLHFQRLVLLAVTNHLNRFVVVGIRCLAAALHRTLKLAHGTVIRVRARRNLHFGNCPVLSRIGERPESRINGHAQILAGVGVLQRSLLREQWTTAQTPSSVASSACSHSEGTHEEGCML